MKPLTTLALASFAVATAACTAPGDAEDEGTSSAAQTACAGPDFDTVARCVVAARVDSSAVDALASLFDAPELAAVAGDDTVTRRATRVYQITAGGTPFTHFGGGFHGESGLHPSFQDGFLYTAAWGGGSTSQMGHFLTGVSLTNAGEVVKNTAGMSTLLGDWGGDSSTMILKLIVGHELLPDDNHTSIPTNARNQFHTATDGALSEFVAAAAADRSGDGAARDAALLRVMTHGHDLADRAYTEGDAAACTQATCTPSACACPWGQGNSLNDLRLSLRAFRLGQKLARSAPFYDVTGNAVYDVQRPGVYYGGESPDLESPFATPAEVGAWIRQNLTQDR